jgi:hypothetical protein
MLLVTVTSFGKLRIGSGTEKLKFAESNKAAFPQVLKRTYVSFCLGIVLVHP